MDIRYQLAEEIAEQIGAHVMPEGCPDCRSPLLEKPDQGMPFCWFCVTDRIAAQRAKDALTKARLAEQGIFIENMEPHRLTEPAPDAEEARGPFRFGMPL